MTFAPKLLLGGVALAGTGVGFGIETLTASKSDNAGLATKNASKESYITVNRECRLHELVSINNGQFKLTTKDEIRKQMGQGGDFGSIEAACLANAGKDIFVSKRENKWGYHQQDQDSQQHQEKFKKYLEGLNSKQ
ncbi:hypothetical protein MHF_0699 [Mycoplasma haemofelis Ohio2]|uniref:Uncharacterized protein n=1 Tax=Mycoplasma haemofelis (strain Ohio2) TaxID=859194 RepID=F6FIC1_MYCHI|nr:hypothetical protein MHF_0699 [Mycoplasma haemofelis Ohio2]